MSHARPSQRAALQETRKMTNLSGKCSNNHHATVVELNGKGVMIEGASGSGKTSLALGLMETFQRDNGSAVLISDDQVILETIGHEKPFLVAHRPQPIAGKIEIRGYGIVNINSKERTSIDLIAKLVNDEEIERYPNTQSCMVDAVEIAMIKVPIRHETQSIRIISAKLNEISTNDL